MNVGLPAVPAMAAPAVMRRMASFIYEGLLLFGIGLVPAALGALFVAVGGQRHPLPSELAFSDAVLRAFTFLLYAFYFVGFWSTRGQTLAMQTWHIRIVTAQGHRLTGGRALLRFLVSCAWFAPAAGIAMLNGWSRWQSLAAIGIGVSAYALLALLRPDRQFWHDAICGTCLIDSPAAGPAARA